MVVIMTCQYPKKDFPCSLFIYLKITTDSEFSFCEQNMYWTKSCKHYFDQIIEIEFKYNNCGNEIEV